MSILVSPWNDVYDDSEIEIFDVNEKFVKVRKKENRLDFTRRFGGYGSPDLKTNARLKVYLSKTVMQVSNGVVS